MKWSFRRTMLLMLALAVLCVMPAFAESGKAELTPEDELLLLEDLLEEELGIDAPAPSPASGSSPSGGSANEPAQETNLDESESNIEPDDPDSTLSPGDTGENEVTESIEEPGESDEAIEGEPEAEEEPELEEEPEEEEVAEPLIVTIYASYPSEPGFGDTVSLSSTVEGGDGFSLQYQWQYNAGGGWSDVGGANGSEYSYVLDEQNAGYSWRLIVERLG